MLCHCEILLLMMIGNSFISRSFLITACLWGEPEIQCNSNSHIVNMQEINSPIHSLIHPPSILPPTHPSIHLPSIHPLIHHPSIIHPFTLPSILQILISIHLIKTTCFKYSAFWQIRQNSFYQGALSLKGTEICELPITEHEKCFAQGVNQRLWDGVNGGVGEQWNKAIWFTSSQVREDSMRPLSLMCIPRSWGWAVAWWLNPSRTPAWKRSDSTSLHITKFLGEKVCWAGVFSGSNMGTWERESASSSLATYPWVWAWVCGVGVDIELYPWAGVNPCPI